VSCTRQISILTGVISAYTTLHGAKKMKLKIEELEWSIWFLLIIPLFGISFYIWGVSTALILSLFAVPIILVVKNEIIKRQFSWKPAYSVGIASFDEDHKKLFDLILQMHRALGRMPGKEEARAVLIELKKYTEYHFSREEAMMEKHGYPDIEKHKIEHQEMISKVQEFLENFEDRDVAVAKQTLRYLQSWLSNHILITDQQYSDFLRSKGES